VTLDTVWKIAVAIFLAGGLYFGHKQLKRDVNGLGLRTRGDRERANFMFLTTVVQTLVYTESKEERLEKGKMFLEAGFPEGRR
jgi:hypothetical protein